MNNVVFGNGTPRNRAASSRREVNAVLFSVFAHQLFERAKRQEGQTMAEYAVVLAVITLLVIGAITLLSTNIGNEITKVANILTK
jgi:Flp pilus assembly pilin Flp